MDVKYHVYSRLLQPARASVSALFSRNVTFFCQNCDALHQTIKEKQQQQNTQVRRVSIRVPKIPPFLQLQAVNKPIKDEDATKTFRCLAIKSPVRRTGIDPLYLQRHKSTEANLQDSF